MRPAHLALLFLAPLPCAACATPSLGLQPRYARFDIKGSAGVSAGATSASADVEQAGLEEDDAFAGRVDLDFGSPHLIGLAQAPSFEGSGTLDATIDDGAGNVIVAGAQVDSRIDLGQYTVALVFDLVPGDTVEVALGIGAVYLDLDFSFEEQGGATVAHAEAAPIPLLAAAASVWLGPVNLAAFAGGIQYELDDDSVSYVDAEVSARWELFRHASLVAGYRLTSFDLEYDDASDKIASDLTLSGAFVGLEARL